MSRPASLTHHKADSDDERDVLTGLTRSFRGNSCFELPWLSYSSRVSPLSSQQGVPPPPIGHFVVTKAGFGTGVPFCIYMVKLLLKTGRIRTNKTKLLISDGFVSLFGSRHHKRPACMLLFKFLRGGAFLFTATPRTRKEFLSRQSLVWLRGRTIGALRAERHTLTSTDWTSCLAYHELLRSRVFLFIVLRSAQHAQIPRFLQFFFKIWPMPLSLLNHSALALFAQRTRIPTSARGIGFCAIWIWISSS